MENNFLIPYAIDCDGTTRGENFKKANIYHYLSVFVYVRQRRRPYRIKFRIN